MRVPGLGLGAYDRASSDAAPRVFSGGGSFAARHLSALHDLPAHRWTTVPSLRQLFEVATVVRRSHELHAASGLSKERCRYEACVRLGVPCETIRSRLYRAWCSGH